MSSADSPGRSISNGEILLIVDLDNTLLSVNSFTCWARYMLAGTFNGMDSKERLALSYNAMVALAKRKFLHERHAITKRRLQQLWTEALSKDDEQYALDRFTSQLAQSVRPHLIPLLNALADGNFTAILATAAAAEYAIPLGKTLGFSHIIASPAYKDFSIAENSGTQKRDNVLAYITAQGWQHRKRIFFTDHEEDLPLILESAMTFWFGSKSALASLRTHIAEMNIIPALCMPSDAILASAVNAA
jgi:phosphoserine phosphatase